MKYMLAIFGLTIVVCIIAIFYLLVKFYRSNE